MSVAEARFLLSLCSVEFIRFVDFRRESIIWEREDSLWAKWLDAELWPRVYRLLLADGPRDMSRRRRIYGDNESLDYRDERFADVTKYRAKIITKKRKRIEHSDVHGLTMTSFCLALPSCTGSVLM